MRVRRKHNVVLLAIRRDTLRSVILKCLVYADANCLLLLKTATMKFITDNGKDVMASESFSLLRESPELVAEVMNAKIVTIRNLK